MQLSVKTFLIFLIGFYIFVGANLGAQTLEGGYISRQSITKGEKQQFYISSGLDTIDLKIFRLGAVKEPVLTLHSLRGGFQTVPDSVYTKGCGWNATAEVLIPFDWKPGIYEADFPVLNGTKKIIFVVKEKELGSFSKVVVCLTVNTYQAYNNWGGKSLYNFNSTDKIAAYKVSYNRPITNDSGLGYFRWSNKFVQWADKEKIQVEYCTNLDLDRDPHFLDHYKVYITVGHDEYWSRKERNACQSFVNHGGRMMILSGNTCWWQVRHEDNLHTLVCYKGFKNDPLHPKQDSIVTCIWERWPVSDTENVLTGVNFDQGGYVNNGSTLVKSMGYGGYTAYHTHHWIYNGTNIHDGEIFGYSSSIVGYETDGTPFHWVGGYPKITGEHKTPKNFCILGISTANRPGNANHATMGYYSTHSGGAVFNAATTNWVDGLYPVADPVVAQITRNVLRRFTNIYPLPPHIVSFAPVRINQDSINQESVFLGRRVLPFNPDIADTFMVHAVDPNGEPLHFSWHIGGNIVSVDSGFLLSADMKKFIGDNIGLKVAVYNSFDTITLDWQLISSSIHFVSIPPAIPFSPHVRFVYKAIAGSFSGPRIRYDILHAPDWLTIDSIGNVTGTTAIAGVYSVSLRATDSHKNTDIQNFTITVKDVVSAITTLPESPVQIQVYPNPFTSTTQIKFRTEEDAVVSLEIIDLRGNIICPIIKTNPRLSGNYEAFWNGKDEAGKFMSAGTYLCRLTAQDDAGSMKRIVIKLIKY